MKFNPILFTTLSAALTTAAVTPRGSRSGGKVAMRDNKPHSTFAHAVAGPESGNTTATAINYFTNWSGAVVRSTGINYARGTFVVPVPQPPPGAADPDSYYGGAIWVGVDGEICNNALIQAGIAITVDGGVPTYQAWYEWVTDEPLEPIDLAVTAGDEIRVSIYAYTPTSGMVMIENLTQNVQTSHSFSNMVAELCFESAEWVVEDFTVGDSLAPFPNYGSATFTDCYSNLGGLEDAYIAEIYQDTLLSECSINTSANSVTCNYV